MENFWKLMDWLRSHERHNGNRSHYEVIFRTEAGDYTLLDIETDDEAKRTYFLLLEYGK